MTSLQIHSGEAAWYGADLAKTSDWALTLNGAQIQELEQAAEATLDRDIAGLTDIDLPLPTLDPILRGMRQDVVDGRGFSLLRGLPVDDWPKEISARAFWAVGQRFGQAVVQNRVGHLHGHV